jgi:hypothetical protein
MSELSTPRIVCAAIKLRSGLTVPSARHFDMTMRLVIASLGVGLLEGAEQGFIDQHGNFYDRKQAWIVAHEQLQIRRSLSCGEGVLYSEHLY